MEHNKSFFERYLRIILVVSAIIIFSAGSSIAKYNAQKDTYDLFKDVLSGKSESSSVYTQVVSEVLSYYKAENQRMFPYNSQLESSDILEYGSFKTKVRISATVVNIKGALEELRDYGTSYAGMLIGAKAIISGSNLSESQKKEMLVGFEESATNSTNLALRGDKISTQIEYYEKVLSLYEFLLANFDDYKIEIDEENEEQIAFYSDRNITRYNQLISEVQILAKAHVAAYERYSEATKQNTGVSADEIENYYSN